MNGAIEALNAQDRGLRLFEVDLARGETTPLIGTGLVDPRRPYWPLQKLRLRFRRLASAIF
jgi:hypothetical protein